MGALVIRHAIVSSMMVWILGVTMFLFSFYVPVMEDEVQQANIVLTVVIGPCAALGSHVYYRQGHDTNGFALGVAMFAVAMLLDAAITVPVFMLPNGITYVSFFTNLGFWLIATLYVLAVVLYWLLFVKDRASEKSANLVNAKETSFYGAVSTTPSQGDEDLGPQQGGENILPPL